MVDKGCTEQRSDSTPNHQVSDSKGRSNLLVFWSHDFGCEHEGDVAQVAIGKGKHWHEDNVPPLRLEDNLFKEWWGCFTLGGMNWLDNNKCTWICLLFGATLQYMSKGIIPILRTDMDKRIHCPRTALPGHCTLLADSFPKKSKRL